MAERINKDAFIANILECFTLLQTYEECYKEILDIIDVVNGLNESDLTIANLKNLIEGSEYISFDDNEAGTKLVISLDRTHLDNVPIANSTHLVTSGGVQKSIANTQSALENTIDTKTQGMLKLPINIPTEPLVVMVDTNNAQTNVPLGDGLAYQNGHLVATGGSSGGVTQSYVDTQDQKILQDSKDYTDVQAQDLSDTVHQVSGDLALLRVEVGKKVAKYTPTDNNAWIYCATKNAGDIHNPLTIVSTPNAIPQRDNKGYLYGSTVNDSDINNPDYASALATISFLHNHIVWKGGQNEFSFQQIFNKPNRFETVSQDDLVQSFEAYVEYSTVANFQTHYILGNIHQVLTSINEQATTYYLLPCNKALATNVNYFILTDHDLGKGLEWNSNKNQVDISHPVVQITQTAYDILTTKDSNTLYVIVG